MKHNKEVSKCLAVVNGDALQYQTVLRFMVEHDINIDVSNFKRCLHEICSNYILSSICGLSEPDWNYA